MQFRFMPALYTYLLDGLLALWSFIHMHSYQVCHTYVEISIPWKWLLISP